MRRDGETRESAKEIYMQVKQMIDDTLANGGGYDDVENIMMDELGLEMDYIYCFM